jgi:hypothetical protein
MKRKSSILLLIMVLSAFPLILRSQTTEYSLRSSVSMEMKIAKGLKVELKPEFRYSPGARASILLIQAGLNYKVASWLDVAGYYRLDGAKSLDSESADGSSLDFSNRFAFDANTKINIKRLTPKIRVRFCNFTDFDSQTDDKSNYLRYRFGLDYDIKGIRLAPFAAAEFYQKLSSGLFSKSRYSIGAEYEFNKKNAVSVGYSFEDQFKKSINNHIFELTYTIKF